jgi:Ca2+ transporting ATPase
VIGILNEGIKTGWTEGITIFIAIFLIISITAGNNWIKER